MKPNGKKIIAGTAAGVGAAVALGMAITGWQIGWGPFRGLFKGYGDEVAAIEEKYDVLERRGEIVFYGASNFRLWTEMEEDLEAYRVQNHGFGGSTDKMLAEYADRILYPYRPEIVFFQTGSNDYVDIKGTDWEKVAACMAYKKQMFDTFHAQLPDAQFVVMSGLLLPGRSKYTVLTQMMNDELRRYCEEHSDYMSFADAEQMTFDGENYRAELFVSDGIHLNREGQQEWCRDYIVPQIERLIREMGAEELRRD